MAEERLAAPLVMRFGAFGDIVLLTVLLRHLQARFGRPVDVISSGPWTRPLLEGQSCVGRLFVIRSRRMPYLLSWDQLRLVHYLRSRGPGPTWYCDLRVGMDLLTRGGVPDGYICDSRAFDWQPEETFADRYVRLGNETPPALAGRLPGPPGTTERAARIELTPARRAVVGPWLAKHGLAGRPFVVVHPGSRHAARRGLRSRAGTSKYWPESRWGKVIRGVRDLCPDHAIVLSGTAAEYSLNQDIIAAAAVGDLHNVARDLPIETLLPVLEQAHSMISVDTGPAHAAAALGCPTVSLFGTANPVQYRPGGTTTPAAVVTGKVDGQQNILGIEPETVIRAWADLVAICKTRKHSVNSVAST